MAIDRERIIDEALSLLDEVGIDGLTTRRLAERLGVKQPALYWHFRAKSTLLDAVNAAMLARFHHRHVPEPGEDWEAFTWANARSMREALLSVRDGARLNAGTRPTEREFSDAEQLLRLYVDAGWTPAEALNIAIAVARYVVGFVLEEQNERERERMDGQSDTPPSETMDELAQFPTLSTALEPLFKLGTINSQEVFEGGLRCLIDGARASLASKGKA